MAVLRHAPGAPFAAAFLSASVSEMPRFEAQHVSSAAWAVADLGLAPPPAWFHAWAVRATALAGDHTPQGLTNMLWALAVQGRYREAVTSLLWGTLLRQLTEWPPDGDPPSPIALHTLYCVWLAAREEAPGTLAQPQPWLLAALRHAWAGRRAEQLATSLSREHSEVMACLAQLGVAFQEERFCERSERHIDVAITQPGVRVALEVDGPHHFSATGARRHPVGSTRLRNRLLSAAGWTVLSVPLDSLPPVGPAARADWVAHLRAALRGVGVQVAAEVAR